MNSVHQAVTYSSLAYTELQHPVSGANTRGFDAGAGAYGCTISGAGPTSVAIVDSLEAGEKVKEAMCKAFVDSGKLEINSATIVRLDPEGAKFV